MTTRVFLVDDHEIVRKGLREVIDVDLDFEVVGEAGSSEEALRRLEGAKPDIVILDVMLGEDSGTELCREILSAYPDVRCLMLTSYDNDEATFNAIIAGASGYLIKDIKSHDLLDSLRHVAKGKSLIDPKVMAQVFDRMKGQTANKPKELASLSDQELRVLEFIAEGLTNRQIAQKMDLADKTVKNYVSHVLAKLGMSRRTEAAVLATKLNKEK